MMKNLLLIISTVSLTATVANQGAPGRQGPWPVYIQLLPDGGGGAGGSDLWSDAGNSGQRITPARQDTIVLGHAQLIMNSVPHTAIIHNQFPDGGGKQLEDFIDSTGVYWGTGTPDALCFFTNGGSAQACFNTDGSASVLQGPNAPPDLGALNIQAFGANGPMISAQDGNNRGFEINQSGLFIRYVSTVSAGAQIVVDGPGGGGANAVAFDAPASGVARLGVSGTASAPTNCNSAARGHHYFQPGDGATTDDRDCVCAESAAGVFKWVSTNLITGAITATGNTTTCN